MQFTAVGRCVACLNVSRDLADSFEDIRYVTADRTTIEVRDLPI
jgi:hypothetical protein